LAVDLFVIDALGASASYQCNYLSDLSDREHLIPGDLALQSVSLQPGKKWTGLRKEEIFSHPSSR